MTFQVVQFPTFICKTSFDKATNQMRWRITASDTDKDFYNERMSVELFNNFVRRIKNDEKVSEQYLSVLREKSGWSGGMPYTSISHYPSGVDGANIPGDVEAVYVDGETLKAKGTFRDTEIGRAVFKAVNEDLAKTSKFENPIRVSIGFLDFKHSHGDFVFERKSLEDVCPMCNNKAGNKTYLDGQLVHFAFTRIPANDRTNVGLEEKSMSDNIQTREEDAKSIVGEELAASLEINKSTAANQEPMSDALVIKSEDSAVEDVADESKEVVLANSDENSSDIPQKEKSALDLAIDAVVSASTAEDVDVALASLGEVIKSSLSAKQPVSDNNSEIEVVKSLVEKSQADILSAISDLAKRLDAVVTEVAVLKSTTVAGKVAEKHSIPAPRSALVTERTKVLSPKQLTQIERIALRSVGEVVE